MLSELPSEIIYQIATHLPSASALAYLSQTCHRLHKIITAENSRIFRAFVKSRFPCIQTPSFWKDAAQALTSRSRALDRHAILARFVIPPQHALKVGSHQATRRDNPTHGYHPAIDSYEVWNNNGGDWADRKEVLVWGAADELVLRIKQSGNQAQEKWLVFNDLDHISSYDDICGVHLLKPNHYSREISIEHMIFGRVRGEIFHLAIAPDEETHEYKQRFLTHGLELEHTDLSDGPDPILSAHLANGSIAFYQTTTGEAEVEPFSTFQIAQDGSTRSRYSKFLSPRRMAVGTGRLENSLAIVSMSSERLSVDREISVDSLDLEEKVSVTSKANVSAIAPLNAQTTGGSSGDVFLAAWGDRAVRLHDLRSDRPFEVTYQDTTDQNPVYCVHPFGHDRFLVGAGGDAVVKVFDLRMESTYSYLDAKTASRPNQYQSMPVNKTISIINGFQDTIRYPRKDFSIFLSYYPPTPSHSTRARPRGNRPYRGPIYTMSSPSPSSPTIYTGIIDGVVRLDFASTDDLTGPSQDWYRDYLDLDLNTMNGSTSNADRILDVSGYERPDPEDLTSTSKLRTQRPFSSIRAENITNEQVTGWDRRWEKLEPTGAWRRQHG